MQLRFFQPRSFLVGAGLFSLASLSLASAPTSVSAAPAKPASRPASASASASLRPGDVLSVTVQKHPEWSVESAVVGNDGVIQIPAIKPIRVSGKSINQIRSEIVQQFKVRLRNPEITVSIKSLQPRRVALQGAVNTPSNVEIGPGWRVSDAIASAGGLRFRADQTTGTLARAGRPAIALNMVKVLANDPSANIELRPDDRLNFVARIIMVRVAGHVVTPGPVSVPEGQGVVEAVSLAGGPKSGAALSKTRIERGATSIPINLYAAITMGQMDSNRTVQEGDLILVPEATGRVSVTGAVVKPGFQDVPDGRTLRISEAIAQAGGAAAGAALTKTVITHGDGTTVPVDLYRVTVQNDPAADVLLQTGDVITVPQARGITVLGTINTPGTYMVEEGSGPRVSDVLARAGGLKTDPNSAKISILRALPDGKQLSLDIDPVLLIEKGDASQNARVFDGDFVNVSSTLRTIYINGVNQDGKNTVMTPGVYDLRATDGLRELLTRAGGANENAALSRIQVQRDGKVETVNLLNSADNFALQPGDNVLVPALEAKVNVLPAVNKPGLVYLPENRILTVGDVLAMAGGPRQGAKIKEIALYRIGPDKTLEQRMVSLNPGIKKKGYYDISTPVQAGDYIYVPEAETGVSGFQKMFQVFTPLAAVGKLFGF